MKIKYISLGILLCIARIAIGAESITAKMPKAEWPLHSIQAISKQKVYFVGYDSKKENNTLWLWSSVELRPLVRNVDIACFDNKDIYYRLADKPEELYVIKGPAYLNGQKAEGENLPELKKMDVCGPSIKNEITGLSGHYFKLTPDNKYVFDFGFEPKVVKGKKSNVETEQELKVLSLDGKTIKTTGLKLPKAIYNISRIKNTDYYLLYPAVDSETIQKKWQAQGSLDLWKIDTNGSFESLKIKAGEWSKDAQQLIYTGEGFIVVAGKIDKSVYFIDEKGSSLLTKGFIQELTILSDLNTLVYFDFSDGIASDPENKQIKMIRLKEPSSK